MTADSLASIRELETPNSQTELKMQTSLDSLRRAESAITDDQPPSSLSQHLATHLAKLCPIGAPSMPCSQP